MEDLLKEKLDAARQLKSFTKEIMTVSLKTEYEKFNSMIDERQKYIEKVDIINNKLKDMSKNLSKVESNEIKEIKKEIRKVFADISEMDNLIRKNLKSELVSVKKSLNHSETSSTLNIKA